MKKGSGAEAAPIPAGSRKIVRSLKEITNCSEAEIYAMLKECNMDPSEAVHRLLTQDTFHEVKSKREKKKETKDTGEARSRSLSNNTNRGARGGNDPVGRSSSQSSSYDYGVTHVKPLHKKENGANTLPTSFISGAGTSGSNPNPRPAVLWDTVSVQHMSYSMAIADGPALPSQPPSGFQHNWSRVPGQMSMADIVRLGKPQSKSSSTPTVASNTLHTSHDPVMSNTSSQSAKQLPTAIAPADEERCHELDKGAGHYNSLDDWSLVGETSAGSALTHQELSRSSICADPAVPSGLLADEANLEQDPCLDENQLQEGDVDGDSATESIRSGSITDGQIETDDSGDSTHADDGPLNGMNNYLPQSHADDGPLNGMNNYHPQSHAFDHLEVEDVNEEVSSVTANLHQLNLQKEELGIPTADDSPAVIIPSHLQVTNADCSHLSFGSFGAGVNATHSGPFPSQTQISNLEMAPVPAETSFNELNSRNPEYYDGDQLKSTLDENVASRTSPSRSYDMPSTSQPEIIRDDALGAAHGLQGNIPSGSDYTFSATTQPTATYTYPDPTLQMQNLSSFSSLMLPYSNSLPNSLLASTVHHLRELDNPLSSLLTTQSMPTKYNTATPSISGPISIPEVKPELFSQQTPQALPTSSIHNAGPPTLPQHLPIHPYSQQTLPLAHFANMIGYPFLPQSYAYLPSAAFQQAYTGTGTSPFHQSPMAAAMKYSPLPQYKTGVSGSSLPQSPAFPPGYGGFANSTGNIPGNFSLNMSSTASASTPLGFEDALNSQYKEGSHYLPLQHNENPAMWVHGAGSRSVSALPGNAFYGFQGQQTQQNIGLRQAQQQPSQYGPTMGYLNMYQSQGGQAQEHHHHHHQNPNEVNLNNSQGPAPHQNWHHGY